jgi:capsular exopolysaccharide synthesis family protein
MNDFIEVHRIIRIVRRRWWVLLVTVLLAVLAGYSFTVRQTKVYRATTSLFIGPAIKDTSDRYSFEISQKLAGVYADIAQRQPVLQAVVNTLQLDQSWQSLGSQVRVEPVNATQLLEIAVEANSPDEAVAIADEVARQLIVVSPRALGNEIDEKADKFVRQRMDTLQTNIESGQSQIEALESSLVNLMVVSVDQLAQRQEEIRMLETLVATWESTYASLYGSMQGEHPTNHLTVFEPAQARTNPVRPLVKLNLLIAAVIGAALGLGLIFLLVFADNTLRAADETAEMLGLPSLGAVSRIRGGSVEDRIFAHRDMFSRTAEDYRLLRSRLLFLSKEWPCKVLLVTSPAQREGKSLIVANLGVAMATIGLKTVIVDANLRNPIQHMLFHQTQTNGLTEEILSSQSKLPHRLKKSRFENLYVLTSGRLGLASPDRLASVRMKEILASLAESADIVICDAPEAGTVADALMLADKANGVLLVVDAGGTRRDSAQRAVDNLRQTGATVLGFVLNRASTQAHTTGTIHIGRSVPLSAMVEEQAPVKS